MAAFQVSPEVLLGTAREIFVMRHNTLFYHPLGNQIASLRPHSVPGGNGARTLLAKAFPQRQATIIVRPIDDYQLKAVESVSDEVAAEAV